MVRSGEVEIQVVSLLNKHDPNDRRHCLRMFDNFRYNDHLCIVYECLEQNLRDTLTMFGKDVGLSLEAVSSYGRQLFIALAHLHKHCYIHADLKPDNILTTKDA
jgi:serine/threonine protein kinase